MLLAMATIEISIASVPIELMRLKSGSDAEAIPLGIWPRIAKSWVVFKLKKKDTVIPEMTTNSSTGIGRPLSCFLNFGARYSLQKSMRLTAIVDIPNAIQLMDLIFSKMARNLCI